MRHLAVVPSEPMDWRDSAACRHHDPDLFFPEGTAGPALRQADRARQVCQSCPVRTPCLRFAVRHGLAFGIWGGTTGEERRAIGRVVASAAAAISAERTGSASITQASSRGRTR